MVNTQYEKGWAFGRLEKLHDIVYILNITPNSIENKNADR